MTHSRNQDWQQGKRGIIMQKTMDAAPIICFQQKQERDGNKSFYLLDDVKREIVLTNEEDFKWEFSLTYNTRKGYANM